MIKNGVLPKFSPIVSLYLRVRARQYFSRIWLILFVTNILAISMGASYVQSSEEQKASSAQIYAELHFGWGMFWALLIILIFIFKLHRSPIQAGNNRDFLSSLPLGSRDSVYCGLIDSVIEGRSVIMFFSFFIATYFCFFGGTAATFLLYALPFLIGIEFATTALAAFLHRQDPRIRMVLIRIGIIYLSLTFASIAWDFPTLGKILSIGIVDPLGMWVGAALLGEKPDLLLPWNVGLYAIAAWSLRSILLKAPTTGLGWADSQPEPLKIYPFDAPALADRFEHAVKSSRLEVIVSIFVVFFFAEAYLVSTELRTKAISLGSPLVFCTIVFLHWLVVFSWSGFSLQRPLPILTSRILFETLKTPTVFIFSALILKAALYFGLGILNGRAASILLPKALLLVVWSAPFATYCTVTCLSAGLLCEWLRQRGVFAWRFLSVLVVAATGCLFWLSNFYAFSYLFEKPVIGISFTIFLGTLMFRLSMYLFDRLEFSESTRPVEPNLIEEYFARRA